MIWLDYVGEFQFSESSPIKKSNEVLISKTGQAKRVAKEKKRDMVLLKDYEANA